MTCKLIQLFKLIRIEPPLRRIISYAGQINGPAFDVEQRQIQGPARRFLSRFIPSCRPKALKKGIILLKKYLLNLLNWNVKN
jgi:hypothetical protein